MSSLASFVGQVKATPWFQSTVKALEKREVQVAVGAGVAVLALGTLLLLIRRRSNAAGGRKDGAGSGKAKAGGNGSKAAPKPADNQYEKIIERDFITADGIGVDFSDVGGLDEQIRQIQELVIYPLSHPHLFRHSRVASEPSGILLYGPPGTGKTMLAKAIAKTAKASFICVNTANIESKWFGETPKLVEAVFTLARKRAPCVIFIDEIDGVLASRQEWDMQHVNVLKTKFLEMMDGLNSAQMQMQSLLQQGGSGHASGAAAAGAAAAAASPPSAPAWVLMVGATNRPSSLDQAILRRLPRLIKVDLPDAAARESILRVILKHERVDPQLQLERLAALTEGYSGSDLKEVVRSASLAPIREAYEMERRMAAAAAAAGGGGAASSSAAASAVVFEPRPISTEDLLAAVASTRPAAREANSYRPMEMLAAGAAAGGAGAGRRVGGKKPSPAAGGAAGAAGAGAAAVAWGPEAGMSSGSTGRGAAVGAAVGAGASATPSRAAGSVGSAAPRGSSPSAEEGTDLQAAGSSGSAVELAHLLASSPSARTKDRSHALCDVIEQAAAAQAQAQVTAGGASK